jgi:ATP-dependent Clp protease adaptor protein ClpS
MSPLTESIAVQEESSTAVKEPMVRPRRQLKEQEEERPKKQPRYNVVLWNDDDHTFDYVIRMLGELFAYEVPKATLMAREVHTSGRALLLTTTREHAELKRDQVHAYGKDPDIPRCQGSMYATIEPVGED